MAKIEIMMKIKNLNYYLWVLVFMVLVTSSMAQQDNQINKTLKDYIEIQNKKINFSGIILVANDSAILSQQSIGFASQELEIPIDIDSKFKIASMTKSYTGLLIALAEQDGKLNLEDRLEKFFPQLTDSKWKQITILQLVSHTSGIPHWNGFRNYWSEASKLSLKSEQVLEEIFEMKLLFEPGTQSAYSSPAYYLLASILEKVYNENYENIINKKINSKLKLKQTGTFNELKIIPKMACGYYLITDDDLIPAPYRDISTMKGGGNIYSTALDMLKWTRSFTSDTIWNKPLLKKIFSPMTDKKIKTKDDLYGMGWYIREKTQKNRKAYHIGGGTFGYSSLAVIYPEEKIHIIVMSNVSSLPMDDVIWKDIESIVFNEPFELPKTFTKSFQLSSKELEKFSGIYIANNGMKLLIQSHENKLFAKAGQNPPFEIYAIKENEFFSKKIDISFTFKQNKNGEITSIQTNGRGRIDNFEKQ